MKEVFGSCPLDCPDACSWVVTVDNAGQAVKLRGRKEHPYTQGQLCTKVNPWLEYAADPSRLTTPLRRSGPKGAGEFEPITWDEAISEMAERFTSIIERSGSAAIWPYAGTGNLGWLQGSNGPGRVWTRMGASAHNLSICSVAGREGMRFAAGTGAWLDPEDFTEAGLIILWGTNTVITNSHLWLIIKQARERGTEVIVVDPLRTRTAKAADAHLAPRVGTDGALALGLCSAIVELGGHDTAFLQNRTLGWEAFEESIAQWTPEAVEHETGIRPEQLDGLARKIIAAPPLAIRAGHGLQRHGGGGQAMRTIACIPAIVGAYDKAGGGSLYSSTGNLDKPYNVAKSRRPELGERPRTLVMTNLGEHLNETDDPRVEALVIHGANPMVSNPGRPLVRQGLERDDLFTVVIDIYPTETAAYADLVLPSTMQHEQFEVNDAYNHRYLHWNEPAVEPVGDCLPHTEIFRRLAAAMGYDEPELQASDEELIADMLDSDALRDAGITMESLRENGYASMPGYGPPSQRPFLTPSGRFEFTSTAADATGHGLLPYFHPPNEATSLDDGQLALVAPASEFHINSTFAGTSRTTSRRAQPTLTMNPSDAADRGIVHGNRVTIGNERGAFDAEVTLSDDVPRGVVATTKGWWGRGVNDTVAEKEADMGGGATFHDNAVTVELIAVT
ncbi:MAG: anaerobic selenocysteine-containing dehydrogenase [Candidatus Poriferisodalaceae bacterium]|jgi:anaerobic selenocysteine-containing dehydrogenase